MCIVTCKVCTQNNSVYAKSLRPIELYLLFLLVKPSIFKVCGIPVLTYQKMFVKILKVHMFFYKKDRWMNNILRLQTKQKARLKLHVKINT